MCSHFSFFHYRAQCDSVDKESTSLLGSSLAASSGDSSKTEVNPSLAQAEVTKASSHPHLLMYMYDV